MAFLNSSTSHSTSCVFNLRVNFRPFSRLRLPIQKTLASKVVETMGNWSMRVHTSPRSTNICSSRVKPIDSDDVAELGCSGTLQASMELTTACLLEGEKITRSPVFNLPDSIRPAMMRRSSNL